MIQAVQSRAQRALQGARSEHEQAAEGSVFGTPGSLVGSPMTEQPASEDRSAGAWSVTRISEVLHRRFVAPVLEHVGGSDRAPSSSPAWHTPTHGVRDPPLMEPETRRAMAAWTSQPTALTTPIPAPPPPLPRDDSSTGSMNQEVVLEEVRRQVQLAMQGRDMELKELRERNQELKRALDDSAQLLNDVMQVGGGGRGRALQEAQRGPSALTGGDLARGGPNHGVPTEAPPGLEGREELPGRNLSGQRQGEPGLSGGSGRGLGQGSSSLGNPAEVMSTVNEGVARAGALSEETLHGAMPVVGESEASSLNLLVQGMRQLQQMYLEKGNAQGGDALKGSVELPQLPELIGETGVEFSDWLYVAEQTIGSLSDSATTWFSMTLQCAKEAYQQHQVATPLDRLSIAPKIPKDLTESKWCRLERKVMTMLLLAMPKAIKEDCVTHRVASVAGILYRLHILYAPGGINERTAVLKQLEGTQGSDNVVEVITALRKWRRTLTRATEMNVSPPDSSVLLKGIELIVSNAVKKHPEVSFRLALARNDLQLQNRPTSDTVLKYYDHVLAELQQTSLLRRKGQPARRRPASTSSRRWPSWNWWYLGEHPDGISYQGWREGWCMQVLPVGRRVQEGSGLQVPP